MDYYIVIYLNFYIYPKYLVNVVAFLGRKRRKIKDTLLVTPLKSSPTIKLTILGKALITLSVALDHTKIWDLANQRVRDRRSVYLGGLGESGTRCDRLKKGRSDSSMCWAVTACLSLILTQLSFTLSKSLHYHYHHS